MSLFALVTALAVVNALEFWGRDAAIRGESMLALTAAVVALGYGVVSAARVSGMSRWWRLAYVASLLCWLLTQALRLTSSLGVGNRGADAMATVAFVLCPLLALVALILLGRSGWSGSGSHRGPLRQPTVTNVLDGLVASLSFLILAAMGGFVHQLTASPVNVGDAALQIVFGLAELAVVGTAVMVAMVYDIDRPFRSNYLYLAGGMVAMAVSYRVAVYLQFVGADAGVLWVGIGFIVGQLLIANAIADISPRRADISRVNRRTDWAQLILPYIGFLGIAVLFAFQVYTGRSLSMIAVTATVVMVFLVVVRQVVAMRAQFVLTRRLYWALGHDTLTGLPNRIRFARMLDEAARDRRFVLILIDLDDFKEINDRYGHAAGDALLCAVAQRLTDGLSEDDTLARIGGDEFAILTRSEGEELEAVADRIRVALRDPFLVQGSSVRVRASMGVVGPDAAGLPETADDLLRHADISMFAGKQHGKDKAVVYQAATGTPADFAIALREADGSAPAGFRLVYQHIVALPERRPVAVEALARWAAPNGMHVSPESFVAAAEAAGMGAALDALVLDLACSDIAAAGLDVDIHVNVGAARLGNTGFDETVRRTLRRHGIDARRLVVEITETVPIVDIPDAAAHIRRLDALGVRVALDDFGSGYNSLAYLHSLPVHIVKLDRSLVVCADPVNDMALYRSVIGLCADLGLVVIAEGIETAAQSDSIQAAGCRLAQGHFYGRPAPIGELGHTQLDQAQR
jgi:diguanylate cyclase